MPQNSVLVSLFGAVFLLAVAIWALVLIVGLVYSCRRYVSQHREAKLVGVACILELIHINQMLFGDITVLFAPVLPIAILEILTAARPMYLFIIHPVAWAFVLLAVFGRSRERYLVEDNRKA